MRSSTPRVASILAATALVAASVLAASAAQAHNYPVSTNPAADSVITEVPDVFSVTTNEALLDLSGSASGFAIQVTDAAGLYYGDGCGVVDGGTYSSGATLGEAAPTASCGRSSRRTVTPSPRSSTSRLSPPQMR